MNLEVLAVQRVALPHLLDEVGFARRRSEGRDEVLMRANVVDDVPGLITPGQRIRQGTRKPPSQLVAFSPLNGVAPPSGQ